MKVKETLEERIIRLTNIKNEYQAGIEDLEKEIKESEAELKNNAI